uniref:Uncharacterized protein n=1 Tax=Anguilla anguilla TaxID=7936 RepID=A0A0E9WKK7_ANGAN
MELTTTKNMACIVFAKQTSKQSKYFISMGTMEMNNLARFFIMVNYAD